MILKSQMKKILLPLLLAVTVGAAAQDTKGRPTSYNYLRGVDAIQQQNYEEAFDYFNKDIQENPKSGYSYSWASMIRHKLGQYGSALTAADMALKLLPKKDSEYVAFVYATRSDIYLALGDTAKAMSDLNTAVKTLPGRADLYEKRGTACFYQGNYAQSEADYQKVTELKPGYPTGHVGLGCVADAQERWDESISHFSHVIKLESDYSTAYSYRAKAYVHKEMWDEATDDIMSALDIDWDNRAFYLACSLEEPALSMLIAKCKVKAAMSPDDASWPYMAGLLYETAGHYKKAVECYEAGAKIEPRASQYRRMSVCHCAMGEYDNALDDINMALSLDSANTTYKGARADIYYETGDVERAIAEWDETLAASPEYSYGYYRRGWFKELSGDLDGAVEDLSTSIVLDPDYTYSRASRGDVYMLLGKTEQAEADFRKVIELEDSPGKYECIHYAYQALGDNARAAAAMDSIIARDPTDSGSYYDAACLYSRMKDKDKALAHLEKALRLGYKRFAHIDRDSDLDFLRETPEFKALISKYRSSAPSTAARRGGEAHREPVVTEVPFTREGGVCKVKCKINGLPLHFVFDTGASDVTLSMVEATFMMKNGYLTERDVMGSRRYMDANGNVSVGTVVNIKSVDFGGMALSNVRASVVRNQKAPLLLGQSVLAKLGKIEIDNAARAIRITRY